MNTLSIIGIIGFCLAAFSVISNDVIQTLGTFLSSNRNRKWWILWAYAGAILTAVLVYGWYTQGGDVSFGRLAKVPLPDRMSVYYLLPPLVLLIITRWGIPVSTTFMILTVFSSGQIIEKMVMKSVFGYAIAFIVSFIMYLIIAKGLESEKALKKIDSGKNRKMWVVAQWLSTGFLWSQWLIQDFANIFVYLPRQLELHYLIGSLLLLLLLLGIIFSIKGGKIQQVVEKKVNSQNIRSATLIDFCYGAVLLFFTTVNTIPMSTTWAFIGILAGREIAITYRLKNNKMKKTYKEIFADLGKVFFGLLVSIILAYGILYIKN